MLAEHAYQYGWNRDATNRPVGAGFEAGGS